jgi:NitT/TauT family transport system ATP-binding protein
MAVALHNVAMHFGAYHALADICLDVAARRFVSIVGPSGCGKSTLLNLIAGLAPPSEGRIDIFGTALTGLNRRASYMFQQDALLPWMTVIDNIKLGLTFRRRDARAAQAEAEAWIDRVGLRGFAGHYPRQLSGGMRKRVAMAQAWIVQPDLMLMDEPFGALDVHTRLRMEEEIMNLWSASPTTVIFVTHDLEEAISLSDEVLLLSAGPASRVIGRYEIGLSRPRNLLEIRTESAFRVLYDEIWHRLKREVMRTYDRYS